MSEQKSTTFGQNAGLVDEMYERYRADPSSVGESWRDFFADYGDGDGIKTEAEEPEPQEREEPKAAEKAAPRQKAEAPKAGKKAAPKEKAEAPKAGKEPEGQAG